MTEQISINAQSSIRIAGETVIYFDPFRITENRNDADIIFVTHEHFDHFSPEDIQKVRKADTIFVAPKSMETQMLNAGCSNLILLTPNETTTVRNIPVKTIPAYNLLKPFHPKKNGWLGYLITVNGQRILRFRRYGCYERGEICCL